MEDVYLLGLTLACTVLKQLFKNFASPGLNSFTAASKFENAQNIDNTIAKYSLEPSAKFQTR